MFFIKTGFLWKSLVVWMIWAPMD